MNKYPAAIYPSSAAEGVGQRGNLAWQTLIEQVACLPAVQPEALAFTLMMRRVRALCGRANEQCDDLACGMCAREILTGYGGSEQDLLDEFNRTLEEVKGFLACQPRLIRKAA